MILIGNKTPESITIGGKEVASIAINNETVWTSSQEEPVDDPVVTCVDNVVTMTCSTSGATINYSTDGGTTYSVYSTPITISATTNYNVYASKDGMTDSNVVTYTATFKQTVATPVVSCTNNVVTMTCATNGATIKYSTNGGSSYSTYSGTITISANTTYTVYATKSGMFDSATTTYTATYKGTVAKPTVSCSNNVVTMSCSTSGATIKYSTNGGSSYSTYSSPITISATTTYTVYATKSGMFDSATTTYKATYVTPKLAKATVTCTSITQSRIDLTFTHSAGSGVTYYINYGATEPSDPTTQQYYYNTKLTGTGNNSEASTYFQINGTNKYIKVLATKSGYNNSDILSYHYVYPSTTPQ